jgi:hypothetical protein
MNLLHIFSRPFCASGWMLPPFALCLFGSKSSSNQTTSVSNNQTSIDASANAAGAQTVTASQRGRVKLDQRSGYLETKGNSRSAIEGDSNLVLGTGANYVENLSDEVVARALDSVDSTTGAAFAFGRDALGTAERAYAGAGAQLAGAITLADTVARRSAEYADASRMTLERIADPASSTSRTILFVVAGLAALAAFLFRPRKPKASA